MSLKIKSISAILLFAALFFSSCGDNEVTQTVTALFKTEKTTYYTNETVHFMNESVNATTYSWDFGNGTTSSEKEPSVTYAETGIYVVKLTAANGNQSATAQRTIQIDAAPVEDQGIINLRWIGQHHFGDIRSVSPAIDNNGDVLMSSNDNNLVKLAAADGAVRWKFDLRNAADGVVPEGHTLSTPSVDDDGTVYIATGSSGGKARFYAINSNGQKKWLFSADQPNTFWNKGQAATPSIQYLNAAIGENSVFIGNNGSTGSIIAIKKSNGERISYIANAANTQGPAGGLGSGVLLTNDKNVVWYGGVYGLFLASAAEMEAATANVPWKWNLYINAAQRAEVGAGGSMAIGSDGTIYGMAQFPQATFDGPAVFAVKQDGTEKWRTPISPVGSLDQGGIAIDANDVIYAAVKRTAGESNGGLIALSATDGRILWRFQIPEDVSSTPAIDSNGNIHLATDNGNYYILAPGGAENPILVKQDLTALILNSGSSFADGWVQGEAKCWSSPVIGDNGVIYVGITNMNDRSKSLLLSLQRDGVKGPANSSWPMKGQNRRHTNKQK